MSRERYQCDWPEACENTALLLFLIEDRREIACRNFIFNSPRCVAVTWRQRLPVQLSRA